MNKRMPLFLLLFFTVNVVADQYHDIKIIESTPSSLVFDWIPANIELIPMSPSENEDGILVTHDFADHISRPGEPDLPLRNILIGVPDIQQNSISIIQQESHSLNNISVIPSPYPHKGKLGISDNQIEKLESVYLANQNFPAKIARVEQAGFFRDIPINRIKLSAVQYNPQSGTLTIYKRIRIRVVYSNKDSRAVSYRRRGKLDNLYQHMLLNFNTARQWQRPAERSLRKPADLPGGTWYKTTITKDGLYKISAATLSSNGISIDGLSISDIRMFNAGAHELNPKLKSDYYNPEYTPEIPIHIEDNNGNGLLDGTDYILFYGKHVNGWFYDERRNDFTHHQHTYATDNIYWLNLSGSNGKRMESGSLENLPGAVVQNHYPERFHFEEDQYNLLASGPDWYGHRFFGRSGSYTKSFVLDPASVSGVPVTFKIRFKGGSGIFYGDFTQYRYYFNIYLNSQLAYSNTSSSVAFRRDQRKDISKAFTSVSVLNEGTNNLEIQYTGNDDACNVYIDYFDVLYPHALDVANNSRIFYVDETEQALRYQFSGFSQDNIHIFDISDPVNPIILASGLSAQNGNLTFDLPASSTARNILICSLSSSEIQNISSLTPFEPGDNLLATGQQADFLIITHKTFIPYAEELAELRRNSIKEPLTTKVVTTDDIYFYFSSGVQDPTAIRNFINYAYTNWSGDKISYVLFFGDGHYDFRNIALPDTNRVPTFEIYAPDEIDSRTVDNYFVDINFNSDTFSSISPDIALGRLPMESKIDCIRYLEKLKMYENNPIRDGWQTIITFVADDEITSRSSTEWQHQTQTETLATLSELTKFIKKKVYLSAYEAVPGGLRYLKPEANEDIIDFINQGTLIINYVGHGSPTTWAHETVFNFNRDLPKINNEGRLPFLIAATCDFAKYDDPHEPSFAEALIWKEKSGVIGIFASVRLVFSNQNAELNKRFFRALFPGGKASRRLGDAALMAMQSGTNDQKYHLFADPTMYLADPREEVEILSITPDSLKALSHVEVSARILHEDQTNASFNGGAVLIVNDARFDSVSTGGQKYYTLEGPLVFKGEVSVEQGMLTGTFIVPKSIRYSANPTGKLTIFAWDNDNQLTAIGFNEDLVINGSVADIKDSDGPDIDIFFEDQENFTSGDLIKQNPILLAELYDENGINMTGATGYKILLQINDETPKNISGFFSYERDKFDKGTIRYPMEEIDAGDHELTLSAFDNLNNQAEEDIAFHVSITSDLSIDQVVNYPNPFRESTDFTFQTNRDGAEVKIKIYTVGGRLIQELDGYFSTLGYNQIPWDGKDRDGDELANGVYLYKIVLSLDGDKVEIIEKMVVIN